MESDSALYSSLLFTSGKGYPLFQPQLSDNLAEDYKKTGVQIGDVGVVSRSGSFNPIFNILSEPGDRLVNRFGVPEQFEQLNLGEHDIDWRELLHPPGADISNTTLNKRRVDLNAGVEGNIFLPVGAGAEIEVSTDSKRAAVLLLPDGASSWDLLALQRFKDYAAKNTRNWYKFVNGRLGWMVANGDLYLVTGVTKSSSWHIAATEKSSGDIKLSLKVKAAILAAAGASGTWSWEDMTSGGRHSGPRGTQAIQTWKNNQTVFLRGFKTYFRLPRPAMLPRALSIADSEWSDIQWKWQVVPYSSSTSTSGGTASASNSQNASSSSPALSDSADSPTDNFVDSLDRVATGYHPSRAISEYLLDYDPTATVAITHDDEWAAVLNEDEEEMPSHHELIRRISNKFEIDTSESGCVFLRPRGTSDGPISTSPLEYEYEWNTLSQAPQSSGKGTVFALIIGINEYHDRYNFPPLRGAVNDAQDFKKYLLDSSNDRGLEVPPDNILCLEDGEATRDGILSAFKSHLLNNEKIPNNGEATMIFFFAGYGSHSEAPMNLMDRDRTAEVICPVDEGTTDGKDIFAIADYVLGYLLSLLAAKKGPNITVIMDTCHSGGLGWDVGRARNALRPSRGIPPELDAELFQDKPDVARYRLRDQRADYVLLAACSAHETAREIDDNGTIQGRFTASFLSCLRWANIGEITYADLVNQIPVWKGQTPHYGGARSRCLIFEGNSPAKSRVSFPLIPLEPIVSTANSLFSVPIGSEAGIIPGTEFTVYEPGRDYGDPLCTLIAQFVQASKTIVTGKADRHPVNIPGWALVRVSDWRNIDMILRVHTSEDFPHTAHLFPAARAATLLRFVEAPLDKAHVVVRTEDDKIVVEPRTGMMLRCHSAVRFTPASPEHLPHVFDGIAHFNYFLDRHNAEDPLSGITLEMHRLRGPQPAREPDTNFGVNGNLVLNGAVKIVSEEDATYGFTIHNTSGVALFPYLFYFDPQDYTIQKLYAPAAEDRYLASRIEASTPRTEEQYIPTRYKASDDDETGQSQRPMAPPLEGTVTIGMAGELGFEFVVKPGQHASSGFLKLFVTSRLVHLRWIEQRMSPFDVKFQGAGRVEMENQLRTVATWDTLTVPLTMTAR